MSSVFPGALDTLETDKADGTDMSTDHPAHHNDMADAVNEIERKVGIGVSTPVASSVLAGTAAGVSGWSTGPTLGSFVAVGTNSATTGAIRLTNNTSIVGRNAAGSGDVTLMTINTLNEAQIPVTMRTVGIIIGDNSSVVLGSTNGTRFGTATTQKIGFFNATPVVQPSSTTDLRQALINLGLYATGGATPLNLNGGLLTAQELTVSGTVVNPAIGSGINLVSNVDSNASGISTMRVRGNIKPTAAIGVAYGNPTVTTVVDSSGTSFNLTTFYGIYSRTDLSATYTGTITTAAALVAANPSKNAGTGVITNAYGLYIESITSGSTANWSIFTGSAPTWLGGFLNVSSYIQTGTSPALSGQIRVPNNSWLTGRNAANSADVNIIKINASNAVEFGTGFTAPSSTLTTSLAVGTNPAASGAIRLPNDTWIVGRNAANSADVNMLRVNASNEVEAGADFRRLASSSDTYITAEATANNASSTFQAYGKTAGGTVVRSYMLAYGGGAIYIGGATAHGVEFQQDGATRLALTTTPEVVAYSDFRRLASSGSASIYCEATANGMGGTVYAIGKTAGGTVVTTYLAAGADGTAYIGSPTNNNVGFIQNSNVIMSLSGGDMFFADGADVVLGSTTGSKIGTTGLQKLAFYGGTPIVQPTVSGSRGANAALASLCSALANLGLIVNSTTA